jgi:exopolyphosphatase
VTGSSAADLDSIVGSICYAHLLAREGRPAGQIFPFLRIPRADLPLRSEAVYLFGRVGLQWENLVFGDDIDLEDLLIPRQGELVLVDDLGNDLAPALRQRITEVIDHHPVDQTAHGVVGRSVGYAAENPAGTSYRLPLKRRIVEPVGSACTLVAEQIMQRKPEILDRQSATLMLAAVLLDTVNLDADAGRATEKDREIAGLLIQAGSADTAGLYEELVRARFDTGELSSNQLLRKDYKEGRAAAVRFGMSSVPLLLDSWRQRDERIEEAFSGFLADKALDLLVVLLYRQAEKLRRQLVICTTDEHLLTHLVSRLAKPLGLSEVSSATDGGEGSAGPHLSGGRRVVIRRFLQREASVSRKRIEPLVREILESL